MEKAIKMIITHSSISMRRVDGLVGHLLVDAFKSLKLAQNARIPVIEVEPPARPYGRRARDTDRLKV